MFFVFNSFYEKLNLKFEMAHASPYKTITDPEIIRKKNELRKAVSEEYIKHTSNPYRNIKMEGGTLVCVHKIFFNLLLI